MEHGCSHTYVFRNIPSYLLKLRRSTGRFCWLSCLDKQKWKWKPNVQYIYLINISFKNVWYIMSNMILNASLKNKFSSPSLNNTPEIKRKRKLICTICYIHVVCKDWSETFRTVKWHTYVSKIKTIARWQQTENLIWNCQYMQIFIKKT